MTLYNRADVVLVPFPFTDKDTTKQRPALVISANWINRQRHCILVGITSILHEPINRDEIPVFGQEATQSGLLTNSIVMASKVFTIDKSRIIKPIGKMPPAVFSRVMNCVAEVIEINQERSPHQV